jgi:hypothetical protein
VKPGLLLTGGTLVGITAWLVWAAEQVAKIMEDDKPLNPKEPTH